MSQEAYLSQRCSHGFEFLSYSAKNGVFNNSSRCLKLLQFASVTWITCICVLLSIIAKAFFQMTHASVLNTWITTVVKGLFTGRWKTAGNSMRFRLCYVSDTMLKRKSSWSVAIFCILFRSNKSAPWSSMKLISLLISQKWFWKGNSLIKQVTHFLKKKVLCNI